MRTSKKQERAAQKLIEMLKASGKVDATKAEEIKSQPVVVEHYLQAETVLLSLEKPAHFLVKKCKRCGESFGTNYKYVGYCSDNCRSKQLAKIGIQWNPYKNPRERWGSPTSHVEPPLVIPPDILYQLARLLPEPKPVESEPVESEPEAHTTPEPSPPGVTAFELDVEDFVFQIQ